MRYNGRIAVTISDEMSANMLVRPSRTTVALTLMPVLRRTSARPPRARACESAAWYMPARAGLEQPRRARGTTGGRSPAPAIGNTSSLESLPSKSGCLLAERSVCGWLRAGLRHH
jgi:hypothetical protein